MAAKTQANCYPTEGLTTQDPGQSPVCTKCNANSPHIQSGCYSSSNVHSCQGCNSCNTVCNSSQAYCSIGHQLIKNHGDVGAHPAHGCAVKDQLIKDNWTAVYWNSLIDKIDTAEVVGKTANQGAGEVAEYAAADPCSNTHPANSLITATKYNQIANKLNRFNVSNTTVSKEEVIRGAHAQAFITNYDAATFNTTVCDVCIAGSQIKATCGCNCSCTCGCGCPCSSGD